jgi:hypothetical protein
VWLDFSEDAGTVTPYMQMQGQDSDILSLAFTYPKSLAGKANQTAAFHQLLDSACLWLP